MTPLPPAADDLRSLLTAAAAEGTGADLALAPGPADDRLRHLLTRLAATILPRQLDLSAPGAPPLALAVENGRIWQLNGTPLEAEAPLCAALRALAQADGPLTIRTRPQDSPRPAHTAGIPARRLRHSLALDDGPDPQARLAAIATLTEAQSPEDWLPDDALLVLGDDLTTGPLRLITRTQTGTATAGQLGTLLAAWQG